ncbi:MAG TPA: UDP-2,3-diacylglucosamine diphosphatase LpxI [Caulobacteraceae bacterium]
MKLGLIAGGGSLPLEIAERRRAAGADVFVLRLKGMADPALARFAGADIGVAELGRAIAALQEAGCDSVCLAGIVRRPDFAALKPDLRGLAALPGALAAARQGDDALLRYLVGEFEREGFRVVGAHEAAADLTLAEGPLGTVSAGAAHQADMARALAVARAIGELDIGQAAVVCDGLVLAVEAQEGTDALLARVAALPPEVRGSEDHRRGVLAKAPKPIQEQRVDLPTIGVATVEAAARAGLAGVAGEAGKVLIVDRAGVVAAADRLGLFVYGAAR